uniref:MD-2-related lipid-recognition domain-containing protein n=1 Tax=Anopheles funestus TaxID=62324 RepID=A0A4Y0BFN4_ANOFN
MRSFEFLHRLMGHLVISVILTFLLNGIPCISNSGSSYSLKVTKYVCIDTPYKESTLHYCKSIPRRNAPTMISVSMDVPNLYNDIVVKVHLFYKFSTYQPFLITTEGKACELIRHPPQWGIQKHVYDIMEDTVPELLVPCPAGNRTYNISWCLQDKYAPRNIPAGEYKLQFKLVAQSTLNIFAMDVYFAVRNTGIISPFMLD